MVEAFKLELDEGEPPCPFIRPSFRPTEIPPELLTRQADIVLNATTSILFIATANQTRKALARLQAVWL